MKNNKMKTRLTCILMTMVSCAFSQDIHFSQFYMNPLQQNPSMAGAINGFEASLIYKDQWRAVASPYKTFGAAIHSRLEGKRMNAPGFLAIGGSFYNDKSGDAKLGTTQGDLSLAYHVKVNDYNRFAGGIQAGYFQRKIDFGALTWASQYDGNSMNTLLPGGYEGNATTSSFDLGAGVNWVFNKDGHNFVTDNHDLNFNVGVAVFHLTRPKYSFVGTGERLPMKIVAHGNGVIGINESKWAVLPGFLYYRQGPAQEIFVGSLIRCIISQDSKFTGFKNGAALNFGAYLRTRDAVSAKFILDYANWSFGVSYDINVSTLKTATNLRGGLELSLRFVAPNTFRPLDNRSRF